MSENGQSPPATGGNSLGPLYAALATARRAFAPIERTRTVKVRTRDGGSYEFAYAPLDTIFAATVGPLADNGLVLTQLLDGTDLVTKIGHTSGAELVSRVAVPQSEQIQQLGSAITYMRRYTAQAMLGLASEEDDDGNAADGNTVETRQDKPAEPPDPKLVKVGFGRAAGTAIGALSDKELQWYAKTYSENIADPEKAKWKRQNQTILDAIAAVQAQRAATQEPPFQFSGDAPAGGPTEADRPGLMAKVKTAAKARKLTDDEKRALGDSILDGEPLNSVDLAKLVSFVEFLEQPEAVAAWRQAQAKGAA